MKKSARKAGRRIKDGQKDEGIGNWLCVFPDDLFRHGVDFDFKKLGYQPLLFNYDDALVAGTSNRD